MMKSAIEKCEKAVSEASVKMEALRKSQELSRSLAEREAPFASLFAPLQNDDELYPSTLMVFSTIIMFCGDTLRHKLDWLFWRFSSTEIRSAIARAKPRSLRSEKEQENACSKNESRCSINDIENLLSMTTTALESIGGVPVEKTMSSSQIRTLAVSFFDSADHHRNYVRRDEFRTLAETHICSSIFLSNVFDVTTRFDNLSEFMRKSIGPLQKLQRGIVRSSQFISMFNQSATTFRPLLNPGLKSILHKRALRRGEKDPLKTDYSKLVPSRSRRGQGVVVELLHGRYVD